MKESLRKWLLGDCARLGSLRFARAAGALWSRGFPQVLVHRHTRLTLGHGFAIEGPGELEVGYDGGHFPRGTRSSLRVGDKARLILHGRTRIFSGHQVSIGDGAVLELLGGGYFNHDARIGIQRLLRVGSRSIFGEEVCIMDSDSHELAGAVPARGIVIGSGVWVGARAMILKNVHIGDGAMVAAGAVVTRDVPPGCLVAGVPARVVKKGVTWQ